MSTRQYIGARYVPQFYKNPDDNTANWKSGVVYEPLTMVMYNSATYTSRKEVPANIGDPASNPDYWVATGNYNGQIAYLQSEIGTLSDLTTFDKDSLVDAINEVDSEIDTFISKFPILNVKDFGAKGDGVTDDTAAIQACVNAATNHNIIYFPSGTYPIEGSINIRTNSIRMFGNFRNSIIKRNGNSGAPLFVIGDGVNTVAGFEIDHLCFMDIIDNSYVFVVKGAQNVYIHDHYLYNISSFVKCGDSVSDVGNAAIIIYNNVGSLRAANNHHFCHVAHHSNGVTIHNNSINSEANAFTVFVYVDPQGELDTMRVYENIVQRMDYGVLIADTYAPNVQNIFIDDNVFDTIYSGCVFIRKTNATGFVVRVFCDSNWFNANANGTSDPITIDAAAGMISQLSFTSNRFVANPVRCIITSKVNNILIDGNIFDGYQLTAPANALSSAITILDADNITIANNLLNASADLPQFTYTYGIMLDSNTTNSIISNNNLTGVTYPLTGTPSNAKGNLPASIDT